MEATLHGPGIVLSECPGCRRPVAHKDLLDNHLLQNLVQIVGPWRSKGYAGTHRGILDKDYD